MTRELGGLGLFLIYQTMDNIEYQASMTGNTLTFAKSFKYKGRRVSMEYPIQPLSFLAAHFWARSP